MRYLMFLFSLFCLMSTYSVFGQGIQIDSLKKHIYYLSDDNLKGRAIGSEELELAAQYIEKHFRLYGLEKKGENGYRQSFDAKVTRIVVPDSIRHTNNIIGFINNDAEYTIVIGAHYDHLGLGDFGGSRDSIVNIGSIHNGADDNASGVAGLLELARFYATNNIQEKYNLLFIAFSGEELGLLGSKYWTNHPTIPLDRINWMLNMDMIGRYNPHIELAVIGYGTGESFPKIFQDINTSLKYHLSKDGNGGSDQTSFYRKNIPVLFFHTGGHDDYHKIGDDADKINFTALRDILEMEIEVINNSMNYEKVKFIWTN